MFPVGFHTNLGVIPKLYSIGLIRTQTSKFEMVAKSKTVCQITLKWDYHPKKCLDYATRRRRFLYCR